MRHVGVERIGGRPVGHPCKPAKATKGTLVLALLALTQLFATSARAASAACPHDVDPVAEETLFTFDTLIYAASSVATVDQYNELRQFLLIYQPNDTLDATFPVRRGVADAVQDWPLALKQHALQYFLTHKAAATNFNALVLQLLGPAPTFVPSDQEVPGGDNEQLIFNHRAKLANLMREAYRVGRIKALWALWQPYWQQSQVCDDHLAAMQKAVAGYLRWSGPVALNASTVISNPLMPYGTGVTCVYSDNHFVMLVGPTQTPREADLLIAHELAHPLLNQLFRNDQRLRAALADSDCVFDNIRRDAQSAVLTRYVYNTWESYFSESLVRSISHRLVGLPDPGRGFALTTFLEREMGRYEGSAPGFSEAMLRTLATLRRDWCMAPQVSHVMVSPHHRARFFRQ